MLENVIANFILRQITVRLSSVVQLFSIVLGFGAIQLFRNRDRVRRFRWRPVGRE